MFTMQKIYDKINLLGVDWFRHMLIDMIASSWQTKNAQKNK